jgi:hypothetical protein
MRLGNLMRELIKLVSPPAPPVALAPAQIQSQAPQDWVARNRCW